jgi:hypothetical protein
MPLNQREHWVQLNPKVRQAEKMAKRISRADLLVSQLVQSRQFVVLMLDVNKELIR